MNDYNSMDIIGSVASEPVRQGKNFSFELESVRGSFTSRFKVTVKNDERPIDINKGDRVFVAKAGFYISKGKLCLAVVDGSSLEVIRKRCNLGEKKLEREENLWN